MSKGNDKIMETLSDIQDTVSDLQVLLGDTSDVFDKGVDIENAILAACLVIAKPSNPQKALADAFKQVEKFMKNKTEQETKKRMEDIKRTREYFRSLSDDETDE